MLMSSKLCQENQCSSSRRFLLDNFLLDLVIVPESYKMRGKEEVQCMTNELVLKSNIKLEGLEEALNIGDYKLGRWNVDTVKQEREHRKDVLLTGFVAQICFVKQKPILHPSRFLVEKDTSQKPQEPNFSRSSVGLELSSSSGVALPLLRGGGTCSPLHFGSSLPSRFVEGRTKEQGPLPSFDHFSLSRISFSPHRETFMMLQCQCRDFSPWSHECPQVL